MTGKFTASVDGIHCLLVSPETDEKSELVKAIGCRGNHSELFSLAAVLMDRLVSLAPAKFEFTAGQRAPPRSQQRAQRTAVGAD